MSMKETRERAYAKLNISLDVTNRREDGYHDMIMVMQTVDIYDELIIRREDESGVRASCNLHFIPGDERNLAVRAAMRFLEKIGDSGQGISIHIKKTIPVGAGMAGGSANAAAVLRGMNRLYGNPLSRKELETLAEGIGSDVAFCVSGGTALAQGRGEQLTDLKPMPECSFLVCKPEFSISTPELFKKLDCAPVRRHPDTAGLLQALEKGELREICHRMYNVFEDVGDRRLRVVTEIKNRLLDHGALGAIMTGTGSAVFGIFEKAGDAEKAREDLKKDYRFCAVAGAKERLL